MESSGPKSRKTTGQREDGSEHTTQEVIASSIELLISEGHTFTEVREYSLPQLLMFVDLIVDRWTRQAEAQSKAMEDDDKDSGGRRKKHAVRTSYGKSRKGSAKQMAFKSGLRK